MSAPLLAAIASYQVPPWNTLKASLPSRRAFVSRNRTIGFSNGDRLQTNSSLTSELWLQKVCVRLPPPVGKNPRQTCPVLVSITRACAWVPAIWKRPTGPAGSLSAAPRVSEMRMPATIPAVTLLKCTFVSHGSCSMNWQSRPGNRVRVEWDQTIMNR